VRILVGGGTGFIGSPLVDALRVAGHGVTLVSRDPGHPTSPAVGWDGLGGAIGEVDAVITDPEEIAFGPPGRWSGLKPKACVSMGSE
jgi:nucleoside-diphosphate-sugar epimerase